MIEKKFKMTDAGALPEEWETTTIESIKATSKNAFVDGPFGSNLKSIHFVKHGDVFVIESSCVTSGKFIPREYKTITSEHFKTISRSECFAKDVIIAKIGMNCGMCAELPKLRKRSIVSGNSMKITINQSKMLNFMFISYMNQAKKEGRFDSLVSESAQPALSLRVLNPFVLPSPPMPEQKRIADSLSDMDEMLDALRLLLEKKKNIKQGVMQTLLSGETRIPGFKGKWEQKKLQQICTFAKGHGLSKSKLSPSGKHKCILYGEIFTTYNYVVKECKSRTEINEGTPSEIGDVIMPASTTTCGVDLAKAIAINEKGVLLGGDILIIRNSLNAFNPYFLAALITELHKKNIAEVAHGTTIIHLRIKDIENLNLFIPTDPKEQEKIAQFISDIDDEITILEERLEKYQAIKQGMMQQLLKGKIRLV